MAGAADLILGVARFHCHLIYFRALIRIRYKFKNLNEAIVVNPKNGFLILNPSVENQNSKNESKNYGPYDSRLQFY